MTSEQFPFRHSQRVANPRPHPFPGTAEGQLALVLWTSWDPVGGAPDEYRLYSPRLLELLRSGVTDREFAAALGELRTERMGMEPSPDADRLAAWAAQGWYQWFVEEDMPPDLDH